MTKKILSLGSIMTVLAWPGLGLANGTDGGHHMMDGWSSMMGGGGLLLWLTWLTWLIVGVLLIIWLIKQINKK